MRAYTYIITYSDGSKSDWLHASNQGQVAGVLKDLRAKADKAGGFTKRPVRAVVQVGFHWMHKPHTATWDVRFGPRGGCVWTRWADLRQPRVSADGMPPAGSRSFVDR